MGGQEHVARILTAPHRQIGELEKILQVVLGGDRVELAETHGVWRNVELWSRPMAV